MHTQPDALRRSITCDQGPQTRDCKHVDVDAAIDAYFYDPHAPCQRGPNGNTNGLPRHYFPNRTDLSTIAEDQLDAAADELNDCPHKRLGSANPTEQLADCCCELESADPHRPRTAVAMTVAPSGRPTVRCRALAK